MGNQDNHIYRELFVLLVSDEAINQYINQSEGNIFSRLNMESIHAAMDAIMPGKKKADPAVFQAAVTSMSRDPFVQRHIATNEHLAEEINSIMDHAGVS
jgi:hypothetical protein